MVAGDAVLAAGVHQNAGAQDIGFQEDAGIFDGTVHVAFRREVDDHIGMLLFKQLLNKAAISDVTADKAEIGRLHNRLQGGQIPGVGQLVQTDDTLLRVMVQLVKDEIAADKTGAAVTMIVITVLLYFV